MKSVSERHEDRLREHFGLKVIERPAGRLHGRCEGCADSSCEECWTKQAPGQPFHEEDET